MFRQKTAFIIGAGAGVDIEMPTGATLIEEIEGRLSIRSGSADRRQAGLRSDRIDRSLRRLSSRDKIDQRRLFEAAAAIVVGAHHMRSIDSYIHAHGHDEFIKIMGKLAIIDTILDYERGSHVFIDWTTGFQKFRDEAKVRASWLDVFMSLLVDRMQTNQNLESIFENVAIINFNYDRCLEQYLYRSLQNSFKISQDAATALMAKLLIHHPYGVIAKLPWQDGAGLHLGGDPHNSEIDLGLLLGNIKTFNEEVEANDRLEEIKTFLGEARHVVCLGFHFHSQNVDLIMPPSASKKMGGNDVYLSSFGREPPELEIVEHQLLSMFRATAARTLVHHQIKSCRPLLASYGTTLIS